MNPSDRISQTSLQHARLAIALYDAPSGEWLETFYFTRDSVTIGRVEGCDLVLKSVLVSRRHLRVWRSCAEVMVEDVASTSGIFLNGAHVNKPSPISPQDRVRFGPYIMQCQAGPL